MSKVGAVYNRIAGDDRCVVEATIGLGTIEPVPMDGEFNDFKDAMNQVFWRDGAAPMTGPFDLNNNNILNIGSVSGEPIFNGNVIINERLTVIGLSELFGDVAVNGDITQAGNFLSTGTMQIGNFGSDVDFGGFDINNVGTIAAAGLVNFTGGANINGTVTIVGNIGMIGTHTVTGNAVITGTSTLNIVNTTTTTTTGMTTCSGGITLSGSGSNIFGLAIIENGFSSEDDSEVNGALNVTGNLTATSIASPLFTGNPDFSGNVDMNNRLSCNDTLIIPVFTPASETAPGAAGTFCYDANYTYTYYAEDEWSRVAHSW